MRVHALIAVFFSAALGGCGTVQTTAPSVQEVAVEVQVPCKIQKPERPAFAVDALQVDAGIWQQMKALRAERLQRQGYEGELEAAIQSCQ